MYTPPGMFRSRSLTRFTMRVGLEHLGQSVLFWVSMTFLRSPVLAIFAIVLCPHFTKVIAWPMPCSSGVTHPEVKLRVMAGCVGLAEQERGEPKLALLC